MAAMVFRKSRSYFLALAGTGSCGVGGGSVARSRDSALCLAVNSFSSTSSFSSSRICRCNRSASGVTVICVPGGLYPSLDGHNIPAIGQVIDFRHKRRRIHVRHRDFAEIGLIIGGGGNGATLEVNCPFTEISLWIFPSSFSTGRLWQ